MYIIALLCPPLALLIYRRWFQFIPNLILWVLAWIGTVLAILPFIGLALGVVFWALAAIHAAVVVKNCKQETALTRPPT
jgi:uncharacterized membrane protein YqaE (UPF0057 family)